MVRVLITDGVGDEIFVHGYCGYHTLKQYVDKKKLNGYQKVTINLLDFQDEEYWESMKNDIVKVGVFSDVGIEKIEQSNIR